MSFINNLFIYIFSKEIGKDQFGNRYYESSKQDYLERFRRQVIYKGTVEATKVPPIWHAWLHYMIDEIPQNNSHLPWQLEYSPNRLLSKFASGRECEGDSEHKTAAYVSVREDLSTESTYKLPAEVEFRKKSNISGTKSISVSPKKTEDKIKYNKWKPLGK